MDASLRGNTLVLMIDDAQQDLGFGNRALPATLRGTLVVIMYKKGHTAVVYLVDLKLRFKNVYLCAILSTAVEKVLRRFLHRTRPMTTGAPAKGSCTKRRRVSTKFHKLHVGYTICNREDDKQATSKRENKRYIST